MRPQRASDGPPLVIVHGTATWGTIRSSDQSLARYLARHADVLFVDPPVSHLTARHSATAREQLQGERLSAIGPSLWRLRPVVTPGKDRPALRAVADVALRRQVANAVRALDGRLTAEIATLPHHLVFQPGDHRRWYWATDDHREGGGLVGVNGRRLARLEDRVAAMADRVLAVSPTLADEWQGRGVEAALLPNGCDLEVFGGRPAATPYDVRLDRPTAVFVGVLTERIDVALLHQVVDRGLDLLVVGGPRSTDDLRRLDDLFDREGVQWVGARPYEELPGYLAAADVGLVPYVDNAYNRASFPLKTLEYLAAGLPVVATDLPALRWLDLPDVTLVTGAPGFGRAAKAAATGDQGPGVRAARRVAASAHTWEARAAEAAEQLGLRRRREPVGAD